MKKSSSFNLFKKSAFLLAALVAFHPVYAADPSCHITGKSDINPATGKGEIQFQCEEKVDLDALKISFSLSQGTIEDATGNNGARDTAFDVSQPSGSQLVTLVNKKTADPYILEAHTTMTISLTGSGFTGSESIPLTNFEVSSN
jgi:hypothetical protein